MQILILIPLAVLALFVWAIASLFSLRGRVARLEEDQANLLARLNRLAAARETSASPRVTPDPVVPSPALAAFRARNPEPTLPIVETVPEPSLEPSFQASPPPTAVTAEAVSSPLPPPLALATPPPPARTLPTIPRPSPINWEQFMGVKMFSWIGGFALFLAVAFFVKYSFDNGWISPALRVAMGYVTGLGLLVGGVFLARRPAYQVAAHSLIGTGVVSLYAASFAAHAFYQLIDTLPTFGLMVLTTAAAFLISVRLPAMPVAILGLVGGFLTPVLLSTGVDNPFGLFGYVTLLNAGLIAVALHRRWYFLTGLGVAGTVLMQLGWAGRFFEPDKGAVALAIFATFNVLFLVAALVAERIGRTNPWSTGAALVLPSVTFAFAAWLLSYREIGARPGLWFSFLLVADLGVLALVFRQPALRFAQLAAGTAAFLCLSLWTTGHLTISLLNWAFAGYLAFALLHSAFPVILQRCRPGAAGTWMGQLFPPMALVLVMLGLFRDFETSWLVWPVILLVDVVAILIAVVTGGMLGVFGVLLLTVAATAAWLLKVPIDTAPLTELLVVCGGFAFFFFIAGLAFGERWFARLELAARTLGLGDPPSAAEPAPPLPAWLRAFGGSSAMASQLPACAAVLPFLLMIMAVARLPLTDPSAIFGLALLLVAMLLVVARRTSVDLLVPVALGCVLALEWVWHGLRFQPSTAAGSAVAWHAGFAALFVAFPFLFRRAYADRILPWATSALAGPLHFFLVHRVVRAAWPNDFIGLLPALHALPMLGALAFVARLMPVTGPARDRLLAWFGGSALFFITLIFPIQFEKQWITVGWAMEGLALVWLFRRVPHPGLRALGCVLLAISFLRLALNPAVFDYHPRSDARLFNWFLYGYGLVSVATLVAARWLAPPRHRVFGQDAPPILYSLGTILAFLLLNIEIADWYSTGSNLTFEFNASFGQDMVYSLAWGAFAFVLLALGFRHASRGARWAGMGLLVVTLLKLFLHDLWRLGGLYRVGSLVGLAVVLIVVSLIYQRFLAIPAPPRPPAPDEPASPSES